MNYWIKFINVLCIIVNSMGLFLGAVVGNYFLASFSGLFVMIASMNLLHEEKKDETAEN